MFLQTQTLSYAEHAEELAVLARALALLQGHDLTEAQRMLIERQDALMRAQRPQVKVYDQSEERL